MKKKRAERVQKQNNTFVFKQHFRVIGLVNGQVKNTQRKEEIWVDGPSRLEQVVLVAG